jgi:hypothetical protein
MGQRLGGGADTLGFCALPFTLPQERGYWKPSMCLMFGWWGPLLRSGVIFLYGGHHFSLVNFSLEKFSGLIHNIITWEKVKSERTFAVSRAIQNKGSVVTGTLLTVTPVAMTSAQSRMYPHSPSKAFSTYWSISVRLNISKIFLCFNLASCYHETHSTVKF